MWTSVFYHAYRSVTKNGYGYTTTGVNTLISSLEGNSFRIWKKG